MILSLENRLSKRKQQDNYRLLTQENSLIDFASNDYLGLAKSPCLACNVMNEVKKYQGKNLLGSTGSRLLTGNSHYAEELENTIATYHGFETGVLFNCGYMANLGLCTALMNDKDCVFFDSSIHASIKDGIRLSKATAYSFRHQDLEHLENKFKRTAKFRQRFLFVQSLYSTDGSKSSLKDLCKLAKTYNIQVIVDEAHSVGVNGPNGKGIIVENGLCSDILALVLTFGKALGSHGAIVLGSSLLKDMLINFAHTFIYTTALPFHSLANIKCAYELLPLLENERQKIKALIDLFKRYYPFAPESHIQAIAIPGNKEAKNIAKEISIQGFDVRAILSPTIQRGKECLRLCLHSFNQKEDLTRLLNYLKAHQGIHA